MRDLLADPQKLLGLEPEDLAGYLLEDLNRRTDQNDRTTLNRNNYLLEVGRHSSDQQDVKKAIMEAWGWLRRQGLIETDPDQGGEWVFVTRRGRAIRDSAAFTAFRNNVVLLDGKPTGPSFEFDRFVDELDKHLPIIHQAALGGSPEAMAKVTEANIPNGLALVEVWKLLWPSIEKVKESLDVAIDRAFRRDPGQGHASRQ